MLLTTLAILSLVDDAVTVADVGCPGCQLPLGFGEICGNFWDFRRGDPEVAFLLLSTTHAYMGNAEEEEL